MSVRAALQRLGFDPDRLPFTLRTALAACVAVWIAWLAGLEHPQWSGMTVWAASLPVRGQLLEKGVYRALGTMLGAAFGTGLLIVARGQLGVVAIGLSVWIGLCAGLGNVVRGFASYGTMLAGYTAAMVALLHSAHSAAPFAVGVDRMFTVLTGVAVALAAGWFASPSAGADDPAAQVQALTRRILGDLANHLSGASPDPAEHGRLLSSMAAIEEGLDQHAAGSLRMRTVARRLRRALLAQVAIVLWMRRPPGESAPAMADLVLHAAHADSAGQADVLRRAAGLVSHTGLRDALVTLAASVEADGPTTDDAPAGVLVPTILHRDWIGAFEASFRATCAVAAVAAVWIVTGWDGGMFMMLGVAIMTTVFSTFDNPAVMVRQVIVGQALGVAGALACRWLVWPLAGGEAGLVAGMMPFVLIGGVLFGHRRAAGPLGFDYNMVLLLLLQPVWPLAGSLFHSLTTGAAVVLGPVIALAAFLIIFPVTGERRLRTLAAMMVHEIEAMAARPGVSHRRRVWRARFYHRVLRLVRWADKTGVSRREVVDGGFALLLAGACVLHIDKLQQRPDLTAAMAKRLPVTRLRLARVRTDPQAAARALAACAGRLGAMQDADAALLADAAAHLSASTAFILRARRSRALAFRASVP